MERLTVLIVRDAARTKIPSNVFDVELPVLQALHERVDVINRAPYTGDEIEAEDLYRRLELKYKAPDADEAFHTVYSHVGALARAMEDGVDVGEVEEAPEEGEDAAPEKKPRGRAKR